jgi:hypothetical protein
MPEFLELAHLPEHHHMAEVDVRSAWVQAFFETQFPAGLEKLDGSSSTIISATARFRI